LADNPLLPLDRVRELYALTLKLRALEQKQATRSAGREALLAAIRIHLEPHDLLSAPAEDHTARSLASQLATGQELPSALRLPLAAGVARGMQAVGSRYITVAIAQAGAHASGWDDALTWAHQESLPLLVVCWDMPAAKRRRTGETSSVLTWTAVSRHAQRLHLPLFPLDGDDAVAVYRVMHEASQRARDGLGPSVLWAVLAPKPARRSEQPLHRLRAYLRARSTA
jgi:pyruvate dehydrogenase E1 component alpha subunit